MRLAETVGALVDSLCQSSDCADSLPHDALSVIKGFRNGLVYGAKIRLPHAAVMTFLFRSEQPLMQKLQIIFRLTRTHAWNLARFVAVYKALLILLRRLLRHEQEWHSFVAGCVGGYLIFSRDVPVNNQIVLYLLARVATGLSKLAYDRWGRGPRAGCLGENAFSWEATIVWGLVMWLFRHHRGTLQPSLQSSMQYLYNDSDHWSNIWTLLIHNK